MKFRFYFFFLFFTFLFLFYPGDSLYYPIFAHNKDLFAKTEKNEKNIVLNPIPVLKVASAPALTAQGVYVVDLNSFTPILKKNEHQKLYPASTTKIVTALVAQDLYQLDQVLTIKETTTEGQLMNLKPDERISVENLMYGMLVYSGNDAAYAFANNYGYDKYMEKMNQKTQSLGMKNSSFGNPAGLDEPNQLSSAYDLSIAGRALLNDPTLRKIVGTKEIVISDVDYKYFHRLTNVNKLLGEIPGLGGLKTGYTELAGENLVSFYKDGDREYLIVILKSEDRFEDTKSVVNWIQSNVEYITPPSF